MTAAVRPGATQSSSIGRAKIYPPPSDHPDVLSAKEHDHTRRMKRILVRRMWQETATQYSNKLFLSPLDSITCLTMMVCLLGGAWLFSGGLVSFIFLLLFIGLLYAIVLGR